MSQRWRVRRTLYDGRWATATQSGISAPRFALYPGPNLPTHVEGIGVVTAVSGDGGPLTPRIAEGGVGRWGGGSTL